MTRKITFKGITKNTHAENEITISALAHHQCLTHPFQPLAQTSSAQEAELLLRCNRSHALQVHGAGHLLLAQ